jgi:hypothetical protein
MSPALLQGFTLYGEVDKGKGEVHPSTDHEGPEGE